MANYTKTFQDSVGATVDEQNPYALFTASATLSDVLKIAPFTKDKLTLATVFKVANPKVSFGDTVGLTEGLQANSGNLASGLYPF